jgi:hypothetical protein
MNEIGELALVRPSIVKGVLKVVKCIEFIILNKFSSPNRQAVLAREDRCLARSDFMSGRPEYWGKYNIAGDLQIAARMYIFCSPFVHY